MLARSTPTSGRRWPPRSTSLLPGVVGSDDSEIHARAPSGYAPGWPGSLGLLGLLYAGLGWLSGLRRALEVMFATPRRRAAGLPLRQAARPRDAGPDRPDADGLGRAVRRGDRLLRADPRLDRGRPAPRRCRRRCSASSGTGWRSRASTVLLLTMFTLLVVDTHVPRRALVRGALLGAVGFEVLKSLANLLLAQTKGQPGLPGVRGRADPAGLDQLLLPPGDVRRRVGLHLAGRARAAHGRGDAGPGGARSPSTTRSRCPRSRSGRRTDPDRGRPARSRRRRRRPGWWSPAQQPRREPSRSS